MNHREYRVRIVLEQDVDAPNPFSSDPREPMFTQQTIVHRDFPKVIDAAEFAELLALDNLEVSRPKKHKPRKKPRLPGGIPHGYKKVPRPCPHHVPCADPNGCSGYEIVPI